MMRKRNSKKNNWIQRAIKKPGAFREQARRAGKTTQQFARDVLANPNRYSPTTVRRARLAQTLEKLRTRRKQR